MFYWGSFVWEQGTLIYYCVVILHFYLAKLIDILHIHICTVSCSYFFSLTTVYQSQGHTIYQSKPSHFNRPFSLFFSICYLHSFFNTSTTVRYVCLLAMCVMPKDRCNQQYTHSRITNGYHWVLIPFHSFYIKTTTFIR